MLRAADSLTGVLLIVVTGGAGFIGSHLADSLLADGWRVTVFDNFDPFYDTAIKDANVAPHLGDPAYALVRGDLRDAQSVRALAQRTYDVIVHLAARAGVRPSIEDPVGYQDVNVAGTQQVLELARTMGVLQFVFGSSSSVYGVNPRVPWSEDDHVLQPISPYASTKVSGELLGHVYASLHGIRFIALRFFTVYGPAQRPDLAIHKFAKLMRAGRPIPVFGDGSTSRDYTYIDDIVDGIQQAVAYLERNTDVYEIVNLGGARTIALRDMIERVAAAIGVHPESVPTHEQPGDVRTTSADVSRARRLLGYRPRVSFDERLRRCAEWFLAERAPARASRRRPTLTRRAHGVAAER